MKLTEDIKSATANAFIREKVALSKWLSLEYTMMTNVLPVTPTIARRSWAVIHQDQCTVPQVKTIIGGASLPGTVESLIARVDGAGEVDVRCRPLPTY